MPESVHEPKSHARPASFACWRAASAFFALKCPSGSFSLRNADRRVLDTSGNAPSNSRPSPALIALLNNRSRSSSGKVSNPSSRAGAFLPNPLCITSGARAPGDWHRLAQRRLATVGIASERRRMPCAVLPPWQCQLFSIWCLMNNGAKPSNVKVKSRNQICRVCRYSIA